jgi:nucleotide-binding universal stress UspA family protein
MAAQLVRYLNQRQPLDITVFYVSEQKQPRRAATKPEPLQLEAFAVVQGVLQPTVQTNISPNLQPNVQPKVGYGSDRAETILKESRRGYDLIVMGATEYHGFQGSLFNALVDRIVQDAPCPTLVVKSATPLVQGEFCPIPAQPLRQILVPTVGSRASLNAVEMAATIGKQTGAQLTLIHVVNTTPSKYLLFDQNPTEPIVEIAREIVEFQAQVAKQLGAEVIPQVLEGSSPEDTILEFSQHNPVDLIFLGSTLRLITGRAFFSHRVDAILRKAPCPVAVISSL